MARPSWKKKRGDSALDILNSKSGCVGCSSCPLKTKAFRVPHYKPEGARILFVGESPSKSDRRRPLGGHAESFVHELLTSAKIDPSKVAIANIVNCRPAKSDGSKRSPKEEELNACRSQLLETIREINPELIVAYGRESLRFFVPSANRGVKKVRGKVYQWQGIDVLAILDPTSPLYSGSETEKRLIIADLSRIQSIRAGDLIEKGSDCVITKITTRPEMEDLIAHVGDYAGGSYDIESRTRREYGHDYYEPDILTYAIAVDHRQSFWVPMMHRENRLTRPRDGESVPGYARDREAAIYWHDALLRLRRRMKRAVMHFAQFDEMYTTFMLRKYGVLGRNEIIVDPRRVECSMILQFVVHNAAKGDTDENQGTYSLKMLAQSRGYPDWDSEMKDEFLGISSRDPRYSYELIPLDPLGKYNALDTIPTLDLRDELVAEMMSTPLGRMRLRLWKQVVREQISEFALATSAGVGVDLEAWRSTIAKYAEIREKRLVDFARLPQVLSWLVKSRGLAGFRTSIRDAVVRPAVLEAPGVDPVTISDRRSDLLNISSTDQMRELLFDHVGLPVMKKTDDGGPSLDGQALGLYQSRYWDLISDIPEIPRKSEEEVAENRLEKFLVFDASSMEIYSHARKRTIEKLSTARDSLDKQEAKIALNSAVGRHLLLARQVEKMISSYVQPIPSRVSQDSLYHPEFKLHGTVTGRLSSWLHTIPMDDQIKKIFRSKFGPDAVDPYYRTDTPGKITGADYSGIEVRLTAIFSDDGRGTSRMLNALVKGEDLHRLVASMMLNKDPADVSPSERRYCKAPHFQHLYLGSPETVAETLWRPDMLKANGDRKSIAEFTAEIEDQFRRYDEGFPEIPKFWNRVQDSLKRKKIAAPLSFLQRQVDSVRFVGEGGGYLVTPFYRVINLEEEMSPWDMMVRPVNWPTQSAAADITTLAAIRVSRKLREGGYKSHLIGTIHDAIYVDTHPDEWKDVVRLVYDTMEDRSPIPWFNCPLIAEVAIGESLVMSEVTRDGEILPKAPSGYRLDRRGNHVEI